MKKKEGVKVEYDTNGVKLYERHYKDGEELVGDDMETRELSFE